MLLLDAFRTAIRACLCESWRGAHLFRIIGEIVDVQVISTGRGIRELRRLRKAYGRSFWRKLKGVALVELADGRLVRAEVHWYEAHGLGRKELKLKRLLRKLP